LKLVIEESRAGTGTVDPLGQLDDAKNLAVLSGYRDDQHFPGGQSDLQIGRIAVWQVDINDKGRILAMKFGGGFEHKFLLGPDPIINVMPVNATALDKILISLCSDSVAYVRNVG